MNWKTMQKAELIEECERMARKLQGLNHATLNDLNAARKEIAALKDDKRKLQRMLDMDENERLATLQEEVDDLTCQLSAERERYAELEREHKKKCGECIVLEDKLNELEHAKENKLYDTIETMDVAVERCLAILPGFESPDETLAVYNARRALDDLALASRKLAS